MKTKLGVPVGVLAAAVYFAALFGGYIPALLLAGYILLLEEDEFLKKSAVKAVALLMTVSFLVNLIGLIPDCLSFIGTIAKVFNGNFTYTFVSRLINVLTSALSLIKTVLFLLLGVKALNQHSVAVPIVDGIIGKYI